MKSGVESSLSINGAGDFFGAFTWKLPLFLQEHYRESCDEGKALLEKAFRNAQHDIAGLMVLYVGFLGVPEAGETLSKELDDIHELLHAKAERIVARLGNHLSVKRQESRRRKK